MNLFSPLKKFSPLGKRDVSLQAYWRSRNKTLFFAGDNTNIENLIINVSGELRIYNQKLGATDYLIVEGTAGARTFRCPNTAAYIAADTDYIWFRTNGSQRSVSTAELKGYDLPRTPVKYLDDAPNTLQYLLILSDNLTDSEKTKLHKDFRLPIYWDGVYSDIGYLKSNRTIDEQYVWPPATTMPTGVALTLISGGVKIDWTDASGGLDQTEIWGQSDGAAYALLYTIDTGTVTKNDDAVTPVDLRYYKLRSKNGEEYSDFTVPTSIAMLGAELIGNGGFDDATGWTALGSWVIGSGKCSFTASSANRVYRNITGVTSGSTYRIKFDILDRVAAIKLRVLGNAGAANFGAPLNGAADYPLGTNTFYKVASTDFTTIEYWSSVSTSYYAIDNVSVKKVLAP
jgi:hypothetical protein